MTKELRNKLLAQFLLVLIQVIFPLITYPVVTAAIGAEGLGKVAFTDSIAQFFIIIASLGIPLYGIREIAIRRNKTEEQSQTFWELFILQLIIALPAAAGIWLTGSFFRIPEVLITLAIANVFLNTISCEWYFQGNEMFLGVAFRFLLIRITAALLIFFLVRNQGDYIYYYAVLVGAVAANLLINLAVIFKRTKFSLSRLNLKQHLKSINWTYGCYLLSSFFALTDSILLGWLSTSEAVGYYNLGYRLIRMSSMMIISLGVVFMSRISFLHGQNDRKRIQEHVQTSQNMIFFLAIPLCVGFFILAPEIIQVVASPNFVRSIAVLRILSIVPLLLGFSHLTGVQLLIPLNNERVYFVFLLAAFIINIIANILLIPGFQEKGAAFSNLITEGAIAVSTVLYLLKNNTLNLALSSFLKYFLSSLLLYPCVYLLRLLGFSPINIILLALLITGSIYLLLHIKILRNPFVKKMFAWKVQE